VLPILTLIIIPLLAPIRTVSPDATKNRKSQVSRQTKAKRTTSSGRVNIKRTQRQRHNQRYGTQRRTKHQAGRRNSRATNNTNKQVNKRTTNRQRNPSHVQHSIQPNNKPNSKKGKSSKGTRQSRPPAPLSLLRKEVLRYQMQILLSDPEMGRFYKKIIEDSKSKK